MQKSTIAALSLAIVAASLGAAALLKPVSGLSCVQASASGSFECKDAGGFDSTCAVASCPVGYTLTGGDSCSADDRAVKSLFPILTDGQYGITCETQGVAPDAEAICCKT